MIVLHKLGALGDIILGVDRLPAMGGKIEDHRKGNLIIGRITDVQVALWLCGSDALASAKSQIRKRGFCLTP